MKKILSIFTICLLFLVEASAQGINYMDFLPLQVGNVWVYGCSRFGMPPGCVTCGMRIRVKIDTIIIVNGSSYYHGNVEMFSSSGYCSGCSSNLVSFNTNIRIDSSTANIIEYTSNSGCPYRPNEILHDSLKARLMDSVRYDCQPPSQFTAYVCRDTSNFAIFGQSRQSREYSVQGFESGRSRRYVKGIGIASTSAGAVFCNNMTQLLGCVIGGVVYGDTGFMVGISKISSEVPETFSLSQNYPNPFNPATKIKFNIPLFRGVDGAAGDRRGVLLVVYDVLGQDIATLVNEQLSHGTYEVEWDGTNYPSGVYYYKIMSGDLIRTRKMVLIK